MTVAELSALVQGLAPALRDFVLSAQKSLSDRVFALETQDLPAGKDGKDGEKGTAGDRGKDGRDGITFDELKPFYDDCGRLSLQVTREGVVIESYRVPGIVDRGVYRAGETYLKGDGATFGGSFWIAQKDTTAKPGDPLDDPKAWRLAVKQGREGKQGPPGPKPGGSA